MKPAMLSNLKPAARSVCCDLSSKHPGVVRKNHHRFAADIKHDAPERGLPAIARLVLGLAPDRLASTYQSRDGFLTRTSWVLHILACGFSTSVEQNRRGPAPGMDFEDYVRHSTLCSPHGLYAKFQKA